MPDSLMRQGFPAFSVAQLNLVSNIARIAEAEETVFVFNGDLVGVQGVFPAAEGGNQHDQRAFRQMEIGDQRVDALEPVTGIDENVGGAGAGLHEAVFIGDGFQIGRAHV